MLEEVFGRLNPAQRGKVTAGINAAVGEVVWFYPADGAAECSRYVAYNAAEKCWYGGALARSCWVDSELSAGPVAASPDGAVWAHETGDDAGDEAMQAFAQTGFFDLTDGEQAMFASRVLPDFVGYDGKALRGDVRVTFVCREYPNGREWSRGPYSIGAAVRQRQFRARARQMAMRLESSSKGSNWRLGAMRVDVQPDGMR
jgi:hypothetical protein